VAILKKIKVDTAIVEKERDREKWEGRWKRGDRETEREKEKWEDEKM